MTIETLIDEVIGREGGYSNHPADRGGETNFGITKAVARENGYAGDMRALPRATAVSIYRRLYWEQPGYGLVAQVAPTIAFELFDTAVNMGVATASGFLQRALNALNRNARDYPELKVDRAIGPRTIEALKAFRALRGPAGDKVLLKALEAMQGERYIALAESRPANEAFLYGWLANRVGLQ
ncbi:lysozyme family protein [Sphingobium sp. JAI105]|uniref:glycoside hydrolase family 108 protein n=1 Tax=Sphingobium sp. JAI105 TaxID=2787715 RepID=UPI0018C9673C|nr:N-acetylmuramidase [Sphingobium sp. JAI105]MBG6116208.1 lysozyme family protein [Sphingobium sp. JAI105]MBG6118766.1 lysozyme family protein [Sphingobium sp. JAI105]